MTNDNELIYVFSRDYISYKKAYELAKNLNSLKSEYSKEFVVNEYIADEDKDNSIVCGEVTTEDWNSLNLEQHNFVKLIKLENN